jgi:hypothetical protein
MGQVVQFPRLDPERDQARLIREARAIYESIFPTKAGPVTVQPELPAKS